MEWQDHRNASLLQCVFFHSACVSLPYKFARSTDVLDGGMVVLAIYTLNFVHPGLWLGLAPRTEDKLVEGAEMSNLTDSRA